MTLLLLVGKTTGVLHAPSSECCSTVNLLLKFLFLVNDIIQTVHTNGSQTCLYTQNHLGRFENILMSGAFLKGGAWAWVLLVS